jgi:flagellar hook-basal body complex protein FliE
VIKPDFDIKQNLDSISSEILNGENYRRGDFARSILNYPAMMVPSVQEPIIKSLSKTLNGNVSLFDPFMGASNTLVTSMKYGLSIFGQDINPLSLLLSQVKTNYYTSAELEDAQANIFKNLSSDKSKKIAVNFYNIDKWFKSDVQKDLSKIYRAICKEPNLKIRKFFWVSLAEVIRLNSNDRTSTFKMHMRSLEEIEDRNSAVIKSFASILKRNIKDIIKFSSVIEKRGYIKDGQYSKKTDVVWADTKKEIKTKRTFNLLVTSPPYGDNHTTVTYGQFSYLLLQWIPLDDIDSNINFDYLKNAQSIDTESLGGSLMADFKKIEEEAFSKSKTLKSFINQFDEKQRKKANKVTKFIHDLDKSIDNMVLKMRKESYMVWTIGNRNVNKLEVQNDIILTELLQSKNINLFTDLERDILSKRMPGRNNFSNTMSKEKILIFKKSS